MELLRFENGDRLIADAYDDCIELTLIILNNKKIRLLNDTHLYFIDLCKNYFSDERKMKLDASLENVNLGIMLNIYFYRIANDMDLGKIFSNTSSNGNWIGASYCCFDYNNIATWIYFTNDKFVFKCTPLYKGLFDDYDMTFEDFINNYREYQNYFDGHLYKVFISRLNEMILSL